MNIGAIICSCLSFNYTQPASSLQSVLKTLQLSLLATRCICDLYIRSGSEVTRRGLRVAIRRVLSDFCKTLYVLKERIMVQKFLA